MRTRLATVLVGVLVCGGVTSAALAKRSKTVTATSLSLSAPALAYGSERSEVFTVEVAASGVTPFGSVTIKAGSKKVCTAVLSGGAGTCSPAKANRLAVGSYTVSASYKGTKLLASSTSLLASLTVSVAPQATITAAPSGELPSGPAEISFTSNETGSTFECSLDGAPFATCSSPVHLGQLAAGPHSFGVRATNVYGLVGASGATATWTAAKATAELQAGKTLSPGNIWSRQKANTS